MRVRHVRFWFGLLAIGSAAVTTIEWWHATGTIDARFASGTHWIVAIGFVCTAGGTYLFHGARNGDPFHTAPFAFLLAQLTLASIGAMITVPRFVVIFDDGTTESFVYGTFAVGGLVLAYAAVLGVFVGTQLEALDRPSAAHDHAEFVAARWARLAVAMATTSAIVMAPLRSHASGSVMRTVLFTVGTATIAWCAIRDGRRWRWARRVVRGAMPNILVAVRSDATEVPHVATVVGSSWAGVGDHLVFLRRRIHASTAVYRTSGSLEEYEPWGSFPGTTLQLDNVLVTRVILDVVMLGVCAVIYLLSTR